MNTELTAPRGTVASSKQALVRDLKSVVGDAEDLLTVMGDSTAEEFAAARTRVEAKLGEVKAGVDAARIAVTRQVSCATEASTRYVKENPWKLMGFAALAGLIAAFLVTRR